MPIQTTYTTTLAPAYEGMVANSEVENIISRQVETAGGIGFGKVAVQGTDDNQIRVSATGRAFRGITVASHFAGFATGTGGTKDAFDQYETVPVLTKGVIWVLASVAVAVGDPVYYVPATGVLTNVATANTAIPGAIFDSSTTGAALAKIRLG